MMVADFMGADPIETADALNRLARDLRYLSAGMAPLNLVEAPMLRAWQPAQRAVHVLTGNMLGHPTVVDGRIGMTSEVYAVCPRRSWVRTLSRYYVLGSPADASVS